MTGRRLGRVAERPEQRGGLAMRAPDPAAERAGLERWLCAVARRRHPELAWRVVRNNEAAGSDEPPATW